VARRSRRLPGNDHSADEALRRVVAASGLAPGQEEAGLAFARSIWKAQQTYHGDTLAREAAVVIAKVVARGLNQPICQAIRSEVFDIPAPIAP